jgi:arginine-tRNA-protein transferase
MLVETVPINGITRQDYDALLATGWFRGSGFIYRSDLLCLDENVFSVQHIRVAIESFKPHAKQERILRRCQGKFRVEIGQPYVTEEKEELYRQHSTKFKAFVHQTLEEILYDYTENPEVSTLEMTVLDGNRIVALSYFDVAVDSMASLLCIYDDEYKKYSPGHYTMLCEIDYGRGRGVKYFYPGYVLDLPSSFDYKLTLGSLERLNVEKEWVKSQDYVRSETLGDIIRSKTKELNVMLSSAGVLFEFRVYPYYSLSFLIPSNVNLLHFPCYYEIKLGNKTFAAAYDVLINQFSVVRIKEADELSFNHHLLLSEEYQQSDVYELRVMKTQNAVLWKVFRDGFLHHHKASVQKEVQ